MRALILVAGAALAVAACSSNDNANNTMNVDENLTTTDMNATDMNATDMNATDMNATMNATDMNAAGNATDMNATTNNAM
jgi:cellulase/cellobiase CelA1